MSLLKPFFGSPFLASRLRGRGGLVLLCAAGAVFLAAMIPLGRWQADRSVRVESRGLLDSRALIGPSLEAPSLADFWDEPYLRFRCLRYWAGTDPYALQLCFDDQARLVEAADERSGTIKIWSLRYQRDRSPYRVDPERLIAIEKKVAAAQLYFEQQRRLRQERARRKGKG